MTGRQAKSPKAEEYLPREAYPLAPKLEQAGVLRVTWRVHPPENQRKSATEACALRAAIPHCVRGSLLLVTWHHHRMPSATRRLSGKGRCVLSGRELARGL